MTIEGVPPERIVTLNLRIPADLHARITEDAQRNRRSLNQQILVYLEQGSERDSKIRDATP